MRSFILRQSDARERMSAAWSAARGILEAGGSAKVTVVEVKPTRTLEQNAKLWAMLHDVSEHVDWPVDGRMVKMTPEDWKYVFTAGLKKSQRVAQGIEGGFVMLGSSTSRMTVSELGELIELIEAFGAERGVDFGE